MKAFDKLEKFDLDDSSTVANVLLCSDDIVITWDPDSDVETGIIPEEQYKSLHVLYN